MLIFFKRDCIVYILEKLLYFKLYKTSVLHCTLKKVIIEMKKDLQPQHQEQVIGVPTVTATGATNFVLQENTLTYFPSDAQGPTFLGATKGHKPILIHCGNCGYKGESKAKYIQLLYLTRIINIIN